ncbi:MAG: hypothetical protein C4291_09880 [Candidatus Dadabacteria bacterium]
MREVLPMSPIVEVQSVPGHIAGALVLNNGIVFPIEDLNPFQDSTLDPTTLGKSIEQKSNVELNKPREERSGVGERRSQTQVVVESEPNFAPLSPYMKTPIYVWTDKEGITHFTNLIKSVPIEFRDQAIKGAKELQKEAQNTP